MLLRRTQRQDKKLVAAGAVTGTTRKIFGNFACALALGRGRAADLQGGPLLTLPITPTLRLPTLLAVRTGAITLGSPPAPPVPRRLLTGRTAIACLGTSGTKPAFTALQQTAAAAERLPADRPEESLTPTAVAGKVKGAHGR